MKKMSFAVISGFMTTMTLFACSKGAGEDVRPDVINGDSLVIASSREQPGLGDSDEDPLGTAWELPEGIRIVRRPHHPFDPSIEKLFGSTNFFYVDVSFVNDRMPGTPPVDVVFPAGLVVISTIEGRFQNGLSIERFVVPVPPTTRAGGGGKDTTTIYVGVSCLNEGMAMPWEENSDDDVFHYPIGKDMYNRYTVTTDPNLLKLLEVLKDKPGLRLTRHWDPSLIFDEDYVSPPWMRIYHEITDMIWKVTNGHGISRNELDEFIRQLEAYK